MHYTHEGGHVDCYTVPEESLLSSPSDMSLRDSLHSAASTDPEFLNLAESAKRDFSHGYYQYPAMMVPNMVGHALDHLAAHRTGQLSVLDPFAGSGTVLTESIARGFDITVGDINPLAVLLCRTKAGPFCLNR